MHKASSIGYGSSSQLYEKAPKQVGMTPNIYQQDGKTISIIYAIAPCPLGYLLVAMTEKGICAVKLGDEAEKLEHTLNQEFQQAQTKTAFTRKNRN
jgi:AraC family transcriptional regulator of adaptative response/methylated-DNA-[protein]-cysteine methyltransferase